ncbi:MAG TPA: hypothetical protein VFN64_08750 [Burkholderiaceae bacterium]|nr:hypothetical protein [Burkholderiaceae bacterium]
MARTLAELRCPPAQLVAAAACALALGVLVYLTDRDPAHASLVPAVPVLAGLQLFGAAGAWLPSLLHPFAFALLTAALQPPNASPAYWACALWWAIDVAFETSQARPIGDALGPVLRHLPSPTEWTAAVGRYVAFGSYDFADVLATTAGACAAAVVLRFIQTRESSRDT